MFKAPDMRGYFAIGIDGVSKAGNMGNLIRTAHGFGAAFGFAINPQYGNKPFSDKAKSNAQVPYYEYETIADMHLPKGCRLVGVEITDEAVDLPTFRHPHQAAYVLGSERMSLSDEVLERCDHVIKIPTKFSLNVATAGAIVMYDRVLTLGKFSQRAASPSAPAPERKEHVRGGPRLRSLENNKG